MNNPYSLDPKSFEATTKPTDDFFQFINGKWLKENPIPPDEAQWGSFYILHLEVQKQLKEIFEEVAMRGDVSLDADARKVRDFYRTGMDVEKLNIQKDEPIRKLIEEVASVSNTEELSRVIGKLHRAGVGAFWGSAADQDAKDSNMMALYLGQGGLGLPDRDYYLKDDEASATIRSKYLSYAEKMLERSPVINAGLSEAPATFMKLETALASASMTQVELRDIEKQYNKMTPAELAAMTAHIDWPAYFESVGIVAPAYMIVCQPKFMEETDKIFATVPLEEIKIYLRWRILNGMANFLGEDFEKEVFEFYGRTFSGATEMKPRWRRVLGVVNGMLDEAVGKLYVEKHFSEDAKKKINALVDHLIKAYEERIKGLKWMGNDTKEKAIAKLAKITRKLGYPDKWKDISTLMIGADSYAENYMNAHQFEFDRQMRKIGKPVDRSEWYMSPQTVNACYSPIMNEILFPAAILQPPFFDPNVDDALNFGGIGMAIGHELTHGFDDQGALFDLNGNLENWWKKEDKERFDKQTNNLAKQFDVYEPLPGLHVNGKFTLGENIADLGGLLIAYDGLKLALKEVPAGSQDVDGLTPYQRFFANYAVTERGAKREEALRLHIQTNLHSPSIYRVNGPLSNMTEFYEAFDCKFGDVLWRDPGDRVKIW